VFSQTTEYALRAMACLALAPGELVPTSTLADKTRVPANYLAKVLQQLAGGGLIKGRRGVGGGYTLAKPSDQINLLEIINVIGELHRIESCPMGLPCEGTELCPLHKAMDGAAAGVMKLLDGVSLRSLVDDPKYTNKPLCETAASLTVGGAKP
jgi:Rrf2 family transcriptional regulator, nitric oxide-sensitive transcriptional repressor